MTTPDPSKVSHTAVFCAKSLAEETDIPYTKEIYTKLLEYDTQLVKDGNNILNGTIRKIIFMFPRLSGMRTQLEGRYLAVNQALAKNKNPYVIELAAGLSPRGLDFTQDKKRLFIETDLPELLAIKKEIVSKIKTIPSNYHFLPVNATNIQDLMKAGEIYNKSDKKKPLAIVHSGLYMYLSRKEQEIMRDNVASVLKKYSPNGMWITTDVSFDVKTHLKNPLIRWRMKRLEKKTGRPFSFFNSQEEVISFMKQGGFKVQIIPGSTIISKLSSLKKLRLNKGRVEKTSKAYNAFVMKLTR